jgi:hypothetical protein
MTVNTVCKRAYVAVVAVLTTLYVADLMDWITV